MNTPNPVPTPAPVLKKPDGSSTASLVAGTPLAVLCVMLFQQVTGHPLDATAATAVGSIGATVLGELVMIVKRLLNKYLPPEGPA